MDDPRELYREVREQAPEALFEEVDRVLAAAQPERGERLSDALRRVELALVARLDPWWTGPVRPNLRRAVERAARSLHDPVALGLALRLGAGYARVQRADDEAHALARLAARVLGTGLSHLEERYAREAAGYLERGTFLPSAEYVYRWVKELSPDVVAGLASAELARGNAGFAALLLELRLVRALADWYLGPPLPNVEKALARWRAERPAELADLAVLLARAYLAGGFVDLRARDHVAALLEGPEATLLGPDEAVGLRQYVDRDAFDYPYAHSYQLAKSLDADELRAAVRRHTRNGSLTAAQRLCEMELVRRYADWYVGDVTQNLRRALDRYLGDEDPATDALWVAEYLAGLYAATLEGAAHARRLVAALLPLDPDAPALREAIQAAGIPADVGSGELLELYRGVVEVEARVEAFRALAAEASAEVSDYEREAYAEVLRFLEEQEVEVGVLGGLSQALGELAEGVVPDGILRSVTAAVEDALRQAVSGARARQRRERVLAELARRDPGLRSLGALRRADLRLLDEVAWGQTHENRVVAALEGFGCGLGGLTLAMIDLPVLILVNLDAVAAIATTYGFDVEEPAERDVLIGLLAGGAVALRALLAGEARSEQPLLDLGREHLGPYRAALALHKTATQIAARLTRQKLVQLLPILGGAVGAGLNFHFTWATTRAALMTYRYRWLTRRFLS
ncbi:MAG: EcsC family protein [Planctomycetota bacterium]